MRRGEPATRRESPPALAFFDDVHAAFERAAGAGTSVFTCRLGGETVRLEIAGAFLDAPITAPLAHQRVADGEAAGLTTRLFDVASSGVPLPPRPWQWPDNPARGDIFGFGDERIAVSYNHFGHILSLLDRARGIGLWVTTDAAASVGYFEATPLLDVLHWWLQPRGLLAVHSAAVGLESGGILLAGKGGSGKSTTTLACLASSLSIAGDDYCLLSTRGDGQVWSLYNSARMERENFARLPHLRPLVSRPAALESGDKPMILLHGHHPEKLIRGFPLRAVVLPQIAAAARSSLAPASQARALRELAVSTINQRAGAGRAEFDALVRVAKTVPCYSLALGTDMRQLADLLEELVLEAR